MGFSFWFLVSSPIALTTPIYNQSDFINSGPAPRPAKGSISRSHVPHFMCHASEKMKVGGCLDRS